MINPIFEDKRCICFSLDYNYLQYLHIVIKSMIKTSNENNKYDIVILHDKHTDVTKYELYKLEYPDNFSIRYIDVTNYMKDYNFKSYRYITYPSYFYLFIPDLFKDYNQVLYLDGDILIRKDVYEIFSEPIDNCVLGVSLISPYFKKEIKPTSLFAVRCKRELKIDPYDYFSSGVLIFNIKECQDFNFVEKISDYFKKESNFYLSDNDLICSIVNKNVKHFNPNWNAHVIYACEESKKLSKIDYWTDPYIIHYVKNIKPWMKEQRDTLPFIEEWKSYE